MTSTLGAELRRLRRLKGDTLREVEEAIDISNAYLSQIETDKAKEPSPRILQKLAVYYGASYEYLMQLAGYLEPSKNSSAATATVERTAKLAAMAKDMCEEDWCFIETVFEAWRQRQEK